MDTLKNQSSLYGKQYRISVWEVELLFGSVPQVWCWGLCLALILFSIQTQSYAYPQRDSSNATHLTAQIDPRSLTPIGLAA